MTTTDLNEPAAQQQKAPLIPSLDLSEAQKADADDVPRKKTFTDKVKNVKDTIKRAVTPRSRTASMNEEELAAAVPKKAKTESAEEGAGAGAGAGAKAVEDKPTYAQMVSKKATKATQAVKKSLGIAQKEEEDAEVKAEEASRLAKEAKAEKKGAVAAVGGGVIAVGLLILGVVLSKAGAKPEPVAEKKKGGLFGGK